MTNIYKARQRAISYYRKKINEDRLPSDLALDLAENLEMLERHDRREKRHVESVIACENISASQSEWRV